MSERFLFEGDFNGHKVRTIEIDGKPWWVAKDVCLALGLKWDRNALRKLEKKEKGVHKVHTPGGDQEMDVINESGLYRLMFRSNKDEARGFQRWVFQVVLPAIREEGAYVSPGISQGQLEDLVKRLATQHAEEVLSAWTGPSHFHVDLLKQTRQINELKKTVGALAATTKKHGKIFDDWRPRLTRMRDQVLSYLSRQDWK